MRLGRRIVAAFTIVELLVSVAVLVLLVLLVSQLFNSATATATMSRKHIDAGGAASLVFDQMANDLSRMVKRPDVNYIFCKNGNSSSTGASDAMFFYSEGPGFLNSSATGSMMTVTGSASTMSLVGYRITTSNPFHSGVPVMERLGENLTWGGPPDITGNGTTPGGPVFMTNPPVAACTLAGAWTGTLGTPPYESETDTSHYQLMSDMVFRMEFCFLLKSGTYALPGATAVNTTTGYSNSPTAIATTVPKPYITNNYFIGGTYPGGNWSEPAGNVYGFPPDLAGIVVTIAVLDDASSKLVPSGGMATLSSALGDSLAGNTTLGAGGVQANPTFTAQVWQNLLQGQGFAQTLHPSIPQLALSQVRVYERTFYLNSQ